MRRVTSLVVLSAFWFGACQRDPGRDVAPMADPLRTAVDVSTEPLEDLPLEEVRASQAAAVSQRIANTEITLTYSRPVARGRELFGALVPYGDVWNPGADQASAIALTRDIWINHNHYGRAGTVYGSFHALRCGP